MVDKVPGNRLRAQGAGENHRLVHIAQIPACISLVEEANGAVGLPAAVANGHIAIVVDAVERIDAVGESLTLQCDNRLAKLLIKKLVGIDRENVAVGESDTAYCFCAP